MPPSTPQMPGLTITFLFDDDVAAGTETLLAVLAPRSTRRSIEETREDASTDELDDAA